MYLEFSTTVSIAIYGYVSFPRLMFEPFFADMQQKLVSMNASITSMNEILFTIWFKMTALQEHKTSVDKALYKLKINFVKNNFKIS